jgi:hypothetical protein
VKHRLRVAAVIAIILVTACGGASPNKQDSQSSLDSSATVVSSGTALPDKTSLGSLVLASLHELKSYRYSLMMEGTGSDVGGLNGLAQQMRQFAPGGIIDTNSGIKVQMDGINADDSHGQITQIVNGAQIGFTHIDDQQWLFVNNTTVGPQAYKESTAGLYQVASQSLDAMLTRQVQTEVGRYPCDVVETVNGVKARQCRVSLKDLSPAEINLMSGQFTSNSTVRISGKDLTMLNFQLWLAEPDRYPVRFHYEMAGIDTGGNQYTFKMDINIFDANQKLEVLPPH